MKVESVEVLPDPASPAGGHAIIRLKGVWLLPHGTTFRVEPTDGNTSFNNLKGWPRGDQRPRATRVTSYGVDLLVGPDIVEAPELLPGTPVRLRIPSVNYDQQIEWPLVPMARRANAVPAKPTTRKSFSRPAPARAATRTAATNARKRIIAGTQKQPQRGQPQAETIASPSTSITKSTPSDQPAPNVIPAAVSPPTPSLQPVNRAEVQKIKAADGTAEPNLGAKAENVSPDERDAGPIYPLGLPPVLSSLSPAVDRRPDNLTDELSSDMRGPGGPGGETTPFEYRPPALPGPTDQISPAHDVTAKNAPAPAVTASEHHAAHLHLHNPTVTHADASTQTRAGHQMIEARMVDIRSYWGVTIFTVLMAFFTALFLLMSPAQDNATSPVPETQPALLRVGPDISALASPFTATSVSPLGIDASGLNRADALRAANRNLYGTDGYPKNPTEAEFWLRAALSKSLDGPGVTWALTQLGTLYANAGAHAQPDYQKARLLWEIASAQRSSVANCFLGQLFEFGLGVTPNRQKAVAHYERAKALGGEGKPGCKGLEQALTRLNK